MGISFLAAQLGIVPDPTEQVTVISQITSAFVGLGTPFHLLIQISTAVLLVFAANTSFADFPRLSNPWRATASPAAHLPVPRRTPGVQHGDHLADRGRLVLIVAFGGSVAALIPLYTVGVFIAFTLSQAGMVRRWHRLRESERGWRQVDHQRRRCDDNWNRGRRSGGDEVLPWRGS